MSRFALFALAAGVALSACCGVASAAPVNKKDWNRVNWDAAEKAMAADDDPDLLVNDEDLTVKEFERRKNQPMGPPDDAALKDPSEWVKHQQSMSGPAMLFCTLKATNSRDGQPWNPESLKLVSWEWRELLKTAGLEAQVYDVSDASEDKSGGASRLLVTTQTGWRGYDLRDFLLEQPDTAEIEWDQVKYTQEDLKGFKEGGSRKKAPRPAADGGKKKAGKAKGKKGAAKAKKAAPKEDL